MPTMKFPHFLGHNEETYLHSFYNIRHSLRHWVGRQRPRYDSGANPRARHEQSKERNSTANQSILEVDLSRQRDPSTR